MISYSAARTLKTFKIRLLVLSIGLMLGLTFEALARKQIIVEKNSAEVVQLDQAVNEIFVAEKSVADVQLSGSKGIYIYGKSIGSTAILASNKDGETVLDLEVQVVHNLSGLKSAISSSYPGENVKVQSTPLGIVLSGDVSSPKASKDIANIAQRHVTGDETVLNNMKLNMPTQVYLSVKVAEVNRTVLNRLDINWGATRRIGSLTFGVLTGRAPIAPGAGTVFNRIGDTSGLNSYGFRRVNGSGSTDISALLDALNREGLSTVLAEPNLVALSGEPASVLVGGEFPFAVPQDQTISIQFKQFGISLGFVPTVMNQKLINLHVKPEVSELDNDNPLTLPTNFGNITVPSIKTRRAETTVELGSGESMVIAGLFSRTMSNRIDELPGLGDIPMLGALFRSTRFQRNETELVVIVTPYLVKPTSRHNLQKPTDNLRFANQLEMIFYNRLNSYAHNNKGDDGCPAGMTRNVAATVDEKSTEGAIFEKQLAWSTSTDPATGDTGTTNDTYSFASADEARLVGNAGFYTE